MGKGKKAALAAAALASLVLSAPANAGCWSDEAADAAMVRDMETMLMVSALRCRLKGVNFLPAYNRFVRESRYALTQVNDTLRDHFDEGFGRRVALNRYDRFVTSIANRYGGGAEGLDCYDMEDITHAALETRGHPAKLVELAQLAGAAPELEGGLCRVGWRRGR